jgi:hypothetical protein
VLLFLLRLVYATRTAGSGASLTHLQLGKVLLVAVELHAHALATLLRVLQARTQVLVLSAGYSGADVRNNIR